NGANGRAHRKRGLMEAVRPLLLRRWAGPVLVVGGGGYIGTHVVEQLLAEGWRVRVLDRLLFGKAPLQDFFGNPRFELVAGDATVFGHSRRPRFDLVANLFTAQAVNDGRITLMGPSQWRPFVHVRDPARAVVAVLDADPERMRGQVFNVGDRRLNMTIGQLARLVQETVSRA